MIYRTLPLASLRIPAPADVLDRLWGEGFVQVSREDYGQEAGRRLKHEQTQARRFTLQESTAHADAQTFKWPKTLITCMGLCLQLSPIRESANLAHAMYNLFI
jgi:hypothetical protein